ncbi:MAG: prenyltransferase/squalene oxidase repeat-containing protein [Gemmataceae bacterium]
MLPTLSLLLALPPTPAAVRAALDRAVPLLAEAAQGHIDQKTCFACHNQAYPTAGFVAARGRGVPLDADLLPSQIEHVREFLGSNADAFRAGRGTGGQVDTAGWALFTLARAGAAPDANTDAVVEYLLQRDADRGYWRTSSDRPPSEASTFAATYLGVVGLTTWAGPEHVGRVEPRLRAAKRWLLVTPAKDTEDRVYKLWGLHAVGANPREAAADLLAAQRSDGGWGQLPTMPSDPYATATALVSLHEAGGLATTSPEYQRGVAFLLRTQQADGSWYVKSRSKPFQPYYESGFPHGKDQFISAAASGWATAALAYALPPTR